MEFKVQAEWRYLDWKRSIIVSGKALPIFWILSMIFLEIGWFIIFGFWWDANWFILYVNFHLSRYQLLPGSYYKIGPWLHATPVSAVTNNYSYQACTMLLSSTYFNTLYLIWRHCYGFTPTSIKYMINSLLQLLWMFYNFIKKKLHNRFINCLWKTNFTDTLLPQFPEMKIHM